MMRRILSTVLLFGIVSLWAYGQQPQPPAQAADQAKPPEAQPPAAPEDAIDPYGKLKEREEKLEKVWVGIKKEVDENIRKLAAENPCSSKILPQIAAKRDAYSAYQAAHELYVQKQAADIKGDQDMFGKASADGSSVPFDYKGEISKLDEEINSIKADLAKYPVDDPAYKETREQLAENITIDEETRTRYQDAQRQGAEANNRLQAAKAYIDAKQQYVVDVIKNVDSGRIAQLAIFAAEEKVIQAKCFESKKIVR
jgi:hypothetical protein